MPLGKYKNFADCEKAVAKKGIKNTGAYCGAIEARIRKGKLKKKVVGKTKDGWEKVKVSGNYWNNW